MYSVLQITEMAIEYNLELPKLMETLQSFLLSTCEWSRLDDVCRVVDNARYSDSFGDRFYDQMFQ